MTEETLAEMEGRTTEGEHRRFAESAATRAGRQAAETIRLFDQDPKDYRQLLIDSFDSEIAEHEADRKRARAKG